MRNELICSIIELVVNLGIEQKDDFVNYVTKVLPSMTLQELEFEYENMQDNCIGLSQ